MMTALITTLNQFVVVMVEPIKILVMLKKPLEEIQILLQLILENVLIVNHVQENINLYVPMMVKHMLTLVGPIVKEFQLTLSENVEINNLVIAKKENNQFVDLMAIHIEIIVLQDVVMFRLLMLEHVLNNVQTVITLITILFVLKTNYYTKMNVQLDVTI